MDAFIQQRCIKLIISDSEHFYVSKKSTNNNMLLFWAFYSLKNPEKNIYVTLEHKTRLQ